MGSGAAVFVFDRSERLVEANPPALALLREGSAFYLAADGLHLRDQMDGALRAQIEMIKRGGAARLAPFAVSAGDARLTVSINPLPQRRAFPPGDGALFLVLAIRSGASADQAVASTAHRFGLSRAESELLREMLAGRAVAQAAARLGRSYNTARSQLQSIFAKTGTHRQAQLIGSVLQRRV
jgi:DNA-binding CsgD family transcriptional regulator